MWISFAIVAGVLMADGFDRPTGESFQGRSVVTASHGMVATSHPLAAQTGLEILRAGGTAADAAIAANAMIGLVEPMSCGIGGDLFVIYWDQKSQKLYGLNASGRSPGSLTRMELQRRGLTEIPVYGPLSWSVPGCVSGWELLHQRFGRLPWAELLRPSIETAEVGFAVTEVIAHDWAASVPRLLEWPDSADTFLIDGRRSPRFGERYRNPRLAESYRLIADHGAYAFYRGAIAEEIARFSQKVGGFLSRSDFAEHQSDWIDPVSTRYRGYDVWELPPNGQGIAALQMLNILEQSDIGSMGPGSADYLHLFVEAKKLAFADRATFYADPGFSSLPVAELISKEYGRRQAARIRSDRAAADVPPGDPKLSQGDTIYLTVVDAERNCCSLIQSNFHGFGSQVVPGNAGFALQNRGSSFSLDEQHVNRFEPGKRPFHTIIPAMVTRDGRPWLCFGVMGGDMQPQGHVQILVNMIDFGMNVQAAGDAARVRHLGSATPTGQPADGVGTVEVESGISDAVVEDLRRRGHRVRRTVGGFGGYQGILIDHENGFLQGGSESRKDGAAVGY